MIEPGLYLNLPEDLYHADEALSSTGVRDLLISPLTYWCNSHMNGDAQQKETPNMLVGSATHKHVVEGDAAFAEAYAVKPDKADYPHALDTAEDLKGWLKEIGHKVGGSKKDLIQRIHDMSGKALRPPIWADIMQDFERMNEGKIHIAADLYEQIRYRAEIIEADPSVRPAFTGGHPEISFFWIDDESGAPMRVRFDYLKTKAIVELKTFSNPFGMPIDAAIARSVATYRYHVRATMYLEAVEQAKKMLRERGADAVRKGVIPASWLEAFIACPLHSFVFVFVEQGLVPNVRVREFRQTNLDGQQALAWQSGYASFRNAVDSYVDCRERFGDKPWIDAQPMRAFDDEEFPPYLFD